MCSCCLVYVSSLSLEDVFDEVIVVDMLDSRDRAHLFWLGRPDLGVTFTKLHSWTLTQYTKCVFLDADTLVSSHFNTHLLVVFHCVWTMGKIDSDDELLN